ncbi:MAG: hypothetical protein ACK5IN_05950 [Microbacterium sp.]|uniref:hypothetical protein n=1 Tax=Microbacterium sp. TaxID=51671 RepID=UPI003A8A7940
MVMFLIRTLIFLASAAIGLLVASWILPGFHIDWSHWWGFLLAIVIFAVLQSILTPWLTKVARDKASWLLGGIGIVSTFIALVVVVVIPGAGIGIGAPWWTWILAPVVVWIFTALATWLLPAIFIKKKAEERRS